MQEGSVTLYDRRWHQIYIEELTPFDQMMRMMTCNRPDEYSPQCRFMRFESYKGSSTIELISKIQFNRSNRKCLAQQFKWIMPMTVHIGPLLTLRVESGDSGVTSLLTNKRRADEEDGLNPVLNESRHRDFIHFVRPCKELVFDIDVHDFDRFCNCVNEKKKTLCPCCWLHIEGAYFILNFMLTRLFGYKQESLLYVFSGGKGIHCFVNDHKAMSLSEEQRLFMYDMMHIGNGAQNNEDSADQALSTWIHKFATPELNKSLEKLFVTQVIQHRNLFVESTAFRQWVETKLRHYYPATHSNLTKTDAWQQGVASKSSVIWDLLKMFEIYDYHAKTMVKPSLFIIYRLYYPIIDKEPLKMSHTIKMPFSIHIKTKNIAVPVDRAFIESTNKSEQIVTLGHMCSSHFNKEDALPPLFANGVALFEKWLGGYE